MLYLNNYNYIYIYIYIYLSEFIIYLQYLMVFHIISKVLHTENVNYYSKNYYII